MRELPSSLPQASFVGALLLLGACVASSIAKPVDLGQGWSQADRDQWYEQTQGSRLLPYRWAMALEVANGTERFFSSSHMQRYGYLPPEASSLSGLPVGFAIDQQDDSRFG